MSVKVFIDGSSGTTGLRIADRLAARPDIELLSISAEGRKNVNERAKVINSADLAFLCLPDAASKEVMPLLRPDVKVLDTSTAFRTDAAWDYGFPELKGQKEKIKNSYRVAVPGCYASGFISIARPLVELGLAPADYPFSCTGISGYSGGGKKMIAEYESADRPAHSKLDAPKSYGLGLAHKHLPEMQKISGLAHTPAFVPVVCDYYSGMQVLVPLDLKLAGTSAEAVAAGIADYYKEGATVSVHALNEPLPENGLYSNALSGSDRMELYMTVNAAGDQMMLVSLFDNLGKGSSGAAIQCMNLMLGMNEIHYRPASQMISEYKDMIEAIQQADPNTDIVLCAVSPVTRAEKARHPGMKQIPIFNRRLKKLAKKMGLKYLDYTDFLKDSGGFLKAGYATGDGYHWKPPAYAKFGTVIGKYDKSLDQ